MTQELRECWTCGEEKPLEAFHQNRPGNRKRTCAECRNEAKRRDRAAQVAAHHAVQHALEGGRLVRPEVCSECGTECRPDAHHDDYDKPLDVRWLCRSCHTGAHGGPNPKRRVKMDLRLPPDLLSRVYARAEELGQTRTKFVERAIEAALGVEQGNGSVGGLPATGAPRSPAESPRMERIATAAAAAPVSPASHLWERQARLNAEKDRA